jgi:hypothetical protein
MSLGRARSGLHIGNLAHAIDQIHVRLGDEDDFVRLHRHKVARDVKKLTGKVLMNKQEFQRLIPNEGS